MPIQGFVRLRKHQLARQAVFGTKVPATRRYPFRGTPSANLNWTDPDVDAGSRDPVAAPYRTASDLTAPLTDAALQYNNLPAMLAAFFGGAEVPTGGGPAKTWNWHPASETLDDPDVFTYEFGDDVLTDWYQFGDGILETLAFTGAEGLGPISVAMGWRFGSFASTGSTDSPVTGTVPTPDLALDIEGTIVYLKDMKIAIASDPGDLGTSQVVDALHSFALNLGQAVDQKRFANGSQNFDIDAYGPGARTIDLACTFAKTADTVGVGSESDAWMSDQAVNRYVRLTFTSTVMTTGATPYSWIVEFPMRYYTREEGEQGGNTTVVLTGHAFFDAIEFEGVFDTTVVCTLGEAELGDVAS